MMMRSKAQNRAPSRAQNRRPNRTPGEITGQGSQTFSGVNESKTSTPPINEHSSVKENADAIEGCIRMLARVLRMKTHPDRACEGFESDWFADVQSATLNKELWVLAGFLSKVDTSITEIPLVCLSHIFREITIVCRYLNVLQSDPAFLRFSDPQWWRR